MAEINGVSILCMELVGGFGSALEIGGFFFFSAAEAGLLDLLYSQAHWMMPVDGIKSFHHPLMILSYLILVVIHYYFIPLLFISLLTV